MELIGFYIYHVAFARYLIILFGRIELDLEHFMKEKELLEPISLL